MQWGEKVIRVKGKIQVSGALIAHKRHCTPSSVRGLKGKVLRVAKT